MKSALTRTLLGAGIALSLAATAAAQSDTLSGKIGGVETKGRAIKLAVVTDTGEQVIDLTPKTELEIVSTGDDGCLVKGLLVKADSIESNDRYFATVVSVYPDKEGRAPPAAVNKAPAEEGQSQNRYFITGEIASYAPHPDDKYDSLNLKAIGRNTVEVLLERPREVRIVHTDPKRIIMGQRVVVIGRKVGSKLLPTRVLIETGETVKGEEFVATLKKKK